MPARSNYLQKIIFGLERHFAGTAKVEQSKLLTERGIGDKREVDITVTDTVGGRDITIGIEVTVTRAGKGWVDEMIGKHRRLPTDKLVLFSQRGFTPGALKNAKADGVETLTLDEPEEVDWADICGKLGTVRVFLASLAPETGTAVLRTTNEIQPEVGPNTAVFMLDGTQAGTFQDLASACLGEQMVVEQINALDDRDQMRRFAAAMEIQPGFYMKDTEGRLHEIVNVRFEGDFTYEETSVDIASATYRGSPVAHGKSCIGGKEFALILTEKDGMPVQSTLVLYKKDNDPGMVLDLTATGTNGFAARHVSGEPEDA